LPSKDVVFTVREKAIAEDWEERRADLQRVVKGRGEE
jgi:hypothetical protein